MECIRESILNELTDVLQKQSAQEVEQAADRIDSYPRVFVCGAGRSGLMLSAFAMRLVQMGKCAYVVGETVTPAIGPGDLLIAASASGNTHTVCHYAQTGKKAGADLLVISASAQSALACIEKPTILLNVPHKDQTDRQVQQGQMMGSLFEQSLLLLGDWMAQYLAEKNGKKQEMRKLHANLE